MPLRDSDAWILWGAELSPYALKLEAMLRRAGLPFRWMPRSGSFFEALRSQLRLQRLVTGRAKLSWPPMSELDEFPLVPFLFGPNGENLYDSSAIGAWLAGAGPACPTPCPALLPREDRALRFAVQLIDEALDEVGLYLVHHQRWVTAARDNGAGQRLAKEMRPLLGPAAAIVARVFPPRQVRRLPYLFSVAPDGSRFDDLPLRLRPPTRAGFPPTHALLEQLYRELLAAVEPIFEQRAFLFGNRMTIADASLYGQVAMNLEDPSARALLHELAPGTEAWVEGIAKTETFPVLSSEPSTLDETLRPLFRWICRSFVPLMQQNRAAHAQHLATGETLFNERAFDAGRSLYDGELLGQPYRSVAKTFQVKVWGELRREWDALANADRRRLEHLLPAEHGLDRL